MKTEFQRAMDAVTKPAAGGIPVLHSKEYYEERTRLEGEMTPMQKRLYGLLRSAYHEEPNDRFHRAAWEVKALYDQIRAE